MKRKRDMNKALIKNLEYRVEMLQNTIRSDEKRQEQFQYDILFLVNHLGLQSNQFPAPRFVPAPKPQKVKLMRCFWNAVQGR